MITPRLISRRVILVSAPAALLAPSPSRATIARVDDLIAAFAAGRPVTDGRVRLDVPVLVDNGNAVAMAVAVDGPAREIAVFADGNPLPEVLRLRVGPAAGSPRFETRIRLATSQTVTALARFDDGSCWRARVELLVTIAACIE